MQWFHARKVSPNTWARAGRDSEGDWHIVLSSDEDGVHGRDGAVHSYYQQRSGKWYTQASAEASAEKQDCASEECAEHLDNLLRRLLEIEWLQSSVRAALRP
ncbi:MAG: hypothetical protein J7551_08050 [Chloroflexi bacterium]|nr:hypothetical protein [Chloroflexota bacterium]